MLGNNNNGFEVKQVILKIEILKLFSVNLWDKLLEIGWK